jgi:hypothetical protein
MLCSFFEAMCSATNHYRTSKRGIGESTTTMMNVALRRTVLPCLRHRGFMSTMTVAAPEEESHFLLILGKPGGGKGTISKKILKVSIGCTFALYV